MTGRRAAPDVAAALLGWYGRHRRSLPWRAPPGVAPDPYLVWLSEIMLQQTTVAAVAPYFETFARRWPTVADLAAAGLDDVLRHWAGLGYYARARNLHRCARAVTEEYGGAFPESEDELRRLPGIGPYTAAAIAAIAFGAAATPVDANVARVVARLFAVEIPLPRARRLLGEYAASVTPERRAGDHAQATMDLGATVCVPGAPRCGDCPLAGLCRGHARGVAARLPRRAPRKERPVRYGVVFWIAAPDGSVLLRRRPESGLLGGMMEMPSTAWRAAPWSVREARRSAPAGGGWKAVPGRVDHAFTHFRLELTVLRGTAAADGVDGVWCRPDRLGAEALPTVMKKVARLVAAADGDAAPPRAVSRRERPGRRAVSRSARSRGGGGR